MKPQDKIRIYSGEHRGRTGVVVSKMIAKKIRATEGETKRGRWLIEFEDGTFGTFYESEMEPENY